MARKGFEGGQANSFDALNIDGDKVVIGNGASEPAPEIPAASDKLIEAKPDKSTSGIKLKGRRNTVAEINKVTDVPTSVIPEKDNNSDFNPENYRGAIDEPYKGKGSVKREVVFPSEIADKYRDGIDATFAKPKYKKQRELSGQNSVNSDGIESNSIKNENNTNKLSKTDAENLKNRIKDRLRVSREKKDAIRLEENENKRKVREAEDKVVAAREEQKQKALDEARRKLEVQAAAANTEPKNDNLLVIKADTKNGVSSNGHEAERIDFEVEIDQKVPFKRGKKSRTPIIDVDSVDIADKSQANINAKARAKPAEKHPAYVEPKGVFGRTWSWVKNKVLNPAVDSAKKTAEFHAGRVASYGGMIKSEFLGNRQLVKREGAIAEHEIADAQVKQIVQALKDIDTYRDNNSLTPRQAKKAEKDAIKLRKKLTIAQEARTAAFSKVQYHEGLAMVQENNKKRIAENFAHIVDERLTPNKEKYDALIEKKQDLNNEILAWKDRLENQKSRLNALKEKMRNNRYMNTDTNKMQVKEAEKNISQAYKEMENRKNRLIAVDSDSVQVKSILDKWDNKKQAYNRYAKEVVEPYNPAKKRVPEPSPYRDPTGTTTEGGDFKNEENGSQSGNENSPDDDVDSKERQGFYGFDKWAAAWNTLFGSKIKVSLDNVMSPEMANANRENNTGFNKQQFAVLVRNAFAAKKDKKGVRISDTDFDQVFEYLQK